MAFRNDTTRPPIAVVGVSALFPGSVDSTGFWTDILAGTDRLSAVPSSHWLIDDHYDEDMFAPDKTYGRKGGFLDDVDFDAMGFGIPPSMIPSTDTAQLLALIVAQRVLDDAIRGQFTELDRSRASVILGVTSGQELLGAMASRMNRPMWLQGMRRAGVPEDVAIAACDQIANLHPEWTEATFPGLLGNVVAGRIANRLDLGGTNCVTDAACASSFSAISMGINELYLGDSDLVIAGGVDTMNDIFMYMCFSKTPALSQTEDIRPFSDKADGTMLGEGIGMVALKRLDDAERDGNDIYCVINGVGASSDGRSKSVYAPVSSGQARALSNTYAKTGFGPDTVELIEAHGTGTVAGDAAEFGGLEIAFNAAGREDRQWCALGSVKSQIGHTKAAAGAAGLFKVVMALHHKVLPQTAKIDQPNPKLDLENSPFHLNTRSRPWVRGSDHERRGSVSSFGFGGSNFHVAMSEYIGDGARAPRLRSADAELVVLCGADGSAVVAKARQCIDEAATSPTDGYLTWLAQSSQTAYSAESNARLALVATDVDDLREKLTGAIERIEGAPADTFSTPGGTHFGVGQHEGDVAFLFPGQGSQYPFMGADLAMQHGEAMIPWDTAADLDWDDEPLQDVVFPKTSFEAGAEEAQEALLTSTQWAQPAIGAASVAMLRLLRSIGVAPAHVGGHSYGEITALHAAGVLTESDMLRVSRRRGELMAEAAQTPGSMTAVACSVEEVRSLVEASGVEVVIANHNSPTQVVLSGATEAIEQIEIKLKEDGITARRLPVATAFHSPVVSGASAAFADFLDTIDFGLPTVPVYANTTAEPYPSSTETTKAQLGIQLANPVRFVEMIEAMYEAGARTFVEVGPATILSGLTGKILKGRSHRAIPLDKKNKTGVAAFLGGLGQLAAAGVPMNLSALWDEYGARTKPHDLPSPKLAVAINGANFGSPYPPQDLNELVGPNPTNTEVMTPPPAVATPAPPAPPAALVPAVVATPNPPASAGVLGAYQAVQQHTAEAHAAYLNSVAQVHSAYLATAQQGLAVLGQLAGGPTVAAPTAPAVVAQPALVQPVSAQPVPVPSAPAAPVVSFAPPTPVQVVPVPVSAAGVVPSGSAISVDELTVLLLSVVSDKTGYPSDMLSMGME
ncbi:MAG: polyketide-type polyunsaturated fatty acid synthase PfaA, partial [Candidatus Poriferisodalaceae bacterium]